jgi:hypothetical protein
VLLHWRLLKEIGRLADPETPLEEKFDTLRWVFTERDKDRRPFSFVSCLRVVGCSPLSPLPYCGLVDAEEVRDVIRSRHPPAGCARPCCAIPSMGARGHRGPPRLGRGPIWPATRSGSTKRVRRVALEGDLFA